MLQLNVMETQVEVTFRGLPADPNVDALARREAHKLERYGQKLVSCRVAIEQPQRHQQGGSPFRVRLFIGAGLQQPIVVTREPLKSDMHESLRTIVLGAFRAARRQIQSMTQRRRGETKALQEPRALVVRLFPGASREEGYGFLKTLDGRELYFHRHSVLHDDYERLAVGTEVRFEEEDGDNGPQASTVQVVNKPGIRTPPSGPPAIDPPRGWGGPGQRRGGRRRKRGATA